MSELAEPSRRVEDDVVRRLRNAGCVFAEDEARLILGEARTSARIEAMVERRAAGEPLEVILGWAEFCGLRVFVEAGVFVPRQRTRLLVAEAARMARPGSVVVDLCCGSGAIGAVLARRAPGIELHAADLEPAAVRCARRNLAGRGEVYAGDLYEALPVALRGRVDVLVCNAPYVPTEAIALMPPEARLSEPRLALDGGPDGLDLQRRVADGARDWLAPGGSVLVESGERQVVESLRVFESRGLRSWVVSSEEMSAQVVIATGS